MGKQVKEFFEVTEKELEMKRTVEKEGKNGKKTKSIETYTEKKKVCHVSNASDYVQHLIKVRGLNPATAMVRVGMDGGGGSMKILVSVSDPTQTGNTPEGWNWSETKNEQNVEGMEEG